MGPAARAQSNPHGERNPAPPVLTEKRTDELLLELRDLVARQVKPAEGTPPRLGNWKVGAPLGKGGMGAVFHAEHVTSGKAAAIKTARSGTAAAEALRHEARSLAGLNHRGIVQVFDHGEDAGLVWMAVQLVEGRTLQELILQQRRDQQGAPARWSRSELRLRLEWLRDFAGALHAMHQRGLVHRDIKPANLMIGGDGTPIVIDFGLSLDVAKDPIVDALAGTAPYMSPEQVLALTELDGRSDVYSLAASFFELLSGRRLVQTSDLRAGVFAEVAYARNPPLSRSGPGLPTTLDAVFAKALAKPVGERYASAAEFAADVDRLIAGKKPLHASEAWVVRISRHRRWLLAGAASAAVALSFCWPAIHRAAAIGSLRSSYVAGRTSIEAALDAMDRGLQLWAERSGEQGIEDLFALAVTEFAPRLTLEAFRRAALALSEDADDTFASKIGACSERVLACGLSLSEATRDELTVTAMFAHLRASRFAAASSLATLAAKQRDERIQLLDATAGLRAGKTDGLPQLDFDHANLSVDRLCCRAFLLLEASTSRPGPRPADLQRLAKALEEHERQLSRSNDARNFVACLLALCRLALDEPAAALVALESRLQDVAHPPAEAERPALAMHAAVAAFRDIMLHGAVDAPRIKRLTTHVEGIGASPELMRRFVGQLQQRQPQDPTGRALFNHTVAAMFDDLLLRMPRPRKEPNNKDDPLCGPTVRLMGYALRHWHEMGDMRPALGWARLCADHAENRQLPGPGDYDVDWRSFFLQVIYAAVRDWPGQPREIPDGDLGEGQRWLTTVCRLMPPPHVEFELQFAVQRCRARPDDQDAHAHLAALAPALEQRCAAVRARLAELQQEGAPLPQRRRLSSLVRLLDAVLDDGRSAMR